MAITQGAETNWHGNPRGDASYATHVIDDAVTDANGYVHNFVVNTTFPLSSLAPAAAIVTPGPDLVVGGNVDGLWPVGAALNVGITVTGGTNISTSITNGTGQTIGPDEMAAQVASALNTLGAGEILAAADGNLVGISALAGVTALTITTWAVA